MKVNKIYYLVFFVLLISNSISAQENSPMKELISISQLQSEDEKYDRIENLLKEADTLNTFYILNYAAKIAFLTEHYVEAEEHSLKLLRLAKTYPGDWNYGNAVHDGNMILGRISLLNKEYEKAGEYLILSGNTPGSPQLNSFGPNMSLANDLLRIGNKEIVKDYFKLCRSFWKLGEEKLASWEIDINNGRIPEFGSNLRY